MLPWIEFPIGLQQKTKIAIQCFDVDIIIAQTAVRRKSRVDPPKKKRCYMYAHENHI